MESKSRRGGRNGGWGLDWIWGLAAAAVAEPQRLERRGGWVAGGGGRWGIGFGELGLKSYASIHGTPPSLASGHTFVMQWSRTLKLKQPDAFRRVTEFGDEVDNRLYVHGV
ncbi:uncharacterized protein A4U43_C03F29650 [Asparagus officinalis]|uniref:Uncharacterized protein n=1 Tax=Asparagus officinalis TaxID=4686 RepID=A0A5P1FDV7_ASPOF|nr:uncharacterized protein A4U43_C03F29650 [Asparagus officinalis]